MEESPVFQTWSQETNPKVWQVFTGLPIDEQLLVCLFKTLSPANPKSPSPVSSTAFSLQCKWMMRYTVVVWKGFKQCEWDFDLLGLLWYREWRGRKTNWSSFAEKSFIFSVLCGYGWGERRGVVFLLISNCQAFNFDQMHHAIMAADG